MRGGMTALFLAIVIRCARHAVRDAAVKCDTPVRVWPRDGGFL